MLTIGNRIVIVHKDRGGGKNLYLLSLPLFYTIHKFSAGTDRSVPAEKVRSGPEQRSTPVRTSSQKHLALLTDQEPDAPIGMAYQALYTNIALSWKQDQQLLSHTVLLTVPSTYPEQGVAAANIAIAAAQHGTFTILVDADLHKPVLHRLFDLNILGLSDLFSSQELTAQTVAPYLSKTSVPDLLLLSAGQKQPSTAEIGRFFSTRLSALLSSLRQFLQESQAQETERKPGLIIFSGPPVLSGTDTSLMSSQIEQTFLVIVAGRTTRTQAIKAQEQLQRAHTNTEGMVLLDV
jgi:Mrp family chromosome partitioning ATPase